MAWEGMSKHRDDVWKAITCDGIYYMNRKNDHTITYCIFTLTPQSVERVQASLPRGLESRREL
eukprot:c39955_g1_i1 orf=132-320(+)